MTPLVVSIVAAIASVVLILVVLELIRSRRLRERYALLWLLTGVVLLVLLHYSTVISKLHDQNTVLAQRLALLEQQLRESG
jgi:beta-lactamase regulating signal transducer with metallopeptidase domain